jgi:hypothetical protein
MDELINQTMAILASGANLLKTPVVNESVKALFSWLKDKFSTKSTKEKLDLVEKGEQSDETIHGLKALITNLIEDNQMLQKELAGKVNPIYSLMENEGISFISKTNRLEVKDHSVGFQDIQGNINFNGKTSK